MYCVHNGKTCLMLFDTEKGKYVYIPERKWDRLNHEEKARYRETHWDNEPIHPAK